MAACRALMGSISVTMTLHPKALSEAAVPFPTSPYPATTATFKCTINNQKRCEIGSKI